VVIMMLRDPAQLKSLPRAEIRYSPLIPICLRAGPQ
jgi:hypothetical protein